MTTVSVVRSLTVHLRQSSAHCHASFQRSCLSTPDYFDDETCRLEPIENPLGPKALLIIARSVPTENVVVAATGRHTAVATVAEKGLRTATCSRSKPLAPPRAIPDTVRAVEGLVQRVKLLALTVIAASAVAAFGQTPATGVTVFEGARVIVGDARPPIENASFIVNGARFAQVGRAADVRAPAGATHVNLAGKTVMPVIIDTHTHLSQTREMLIDDLRRRAYFGVGAALSLGQDTTDASFQLRAQTMPGLARFFTAGRGITAPEPGRTTAPYWVTTTAEARKAVQENAANRHRWEHAVCAALRNGGHGGCRDETDAGDRRGHEQRSAVSQDEQHGYDRTE